MYMLDTNICIYVLKTHSKNIRQQFRVHRELCISSITYAELCYGVENSPESLRGQRWRQLGDFVRRLLVLPFDDSVGPVYGRIRADLRRKGSLIGANDLLIAAHALATESVLVTNNVREFGRVDGLRVENWA